MNVEKIAGDVFQGGHALSAIGIGAFVLATALDGTDRIASNMKVKEQRNKNEQELKKRMKREAQSDDKYGFGNIDTTDIVFEMWNDRIGHHKMGNSKFL